MALNITKSYEQIKITTLVAILYGDPGIGKTSLSFTADAPLCLDFDKGAHRAENRGDTVRVENWGDVESMTEEDLKDYSTIILDTGGRALDAITANLIKKDPKLSRSTGELTLQGFGALKAAFTAWLKKIRSYGKDVIIVCHMKEDKKGDDTIFRPDMQGGSYGEIFKSADTIGFMHAADGEAHGVIEFNPSSRWVGKNPGHLESPMPVPNFMTTPNFLGSVLPRIKKALEEMSAASQAIFQEVQQYAEIIDGIDTADKMNAFVAAMQTEETTDGVKVQIKHLIGKRARDLGLSFDKESGKFTIKEEGNGVMPAAETEAPKKEEKEPASAKKKASKKASSKTKSKAA